MPKYEIYVQDKVTYCKTYEAAHGGDAWKQFYDEKNANRLMPIDSDELYSEIEEVETE